MQQTSNYKFAVAAHWWADLLRRHCQLYNDALSAGVEIIGLTPVGLEQTETFEAALEHQIRRSITEDIRAKAQLILFNAQRPCYPLVRAAEVAGINNLYQRLPHHTLMWIYPGQIFVNYGDHVAPGTPQSIWSTHLPEPPNEIKKSLPSCFDRTSKVTLVANSVWAERLARMKFRL